MKCCKKRKFTFQKINSKPVLLFLTWLFVLGLSNQTVIASNLISHPSQLIFVNFNNIQFMLYPLVGVLMDVYSVRLKMMKFCAFAVFPSLLIDLVSNTLTFIGLPCLELKWIAIVGFTVPFSLFRTNIIPLYMDQLLGSSSYELSAVIYWHTFALVVPVLAVEIIFAIVTEESHLFIMQLTILLVTLYSIPCSYSKVPADMYEDHPQIKNPIKLVCNVLRFAFRNNSKRYRSAFTYWEEKCPSRIDQGKRKYGGPYEECDVEDVKTALRLVPVLICTVGHLSVIRSGSISKEAFTEFFSVALHANVNLLPARITVYGTIIASIVIHQLVLKPMFAELIPTMLTRMGIGLFFVLLSTTTTTLISLLEADGNDALCLSETNTSFLIGNEKYIPLLYFVPLYFNGLSYFLIVTASLEFTVAQSPVHMRSLIVGLWYMFWGIGTMLNVNLHHFLHCKLHYLITIGIMNLVVMVLFLLFAKNYKLRMRNTVYNAHRIAEEKVMRNIENSQTGYDACD